MMTNGQATKKQATELRKNHQYQQALPLYEDLWTNHRAECDEWDGWGYAYCLRKLNRAREALAVCKAVYKLKPEFSYNNSEYAWCLYELEVKKEAEQIKTNEGPFFKAASLIIKLVPQDKFSARAKAVLAVVDYLKSKNNVPANDIIDWLKQLDPATLSTEPFAFNDAEGKRRELASDQERWYANMTQALEQASQWQDCVAVCNRALDTIKTFHYDNNIWIRRRRAIAMAHLGQRDEALAELEALLKTKKEWFIQHEIARLLFEAGRADEALSYAIAAALNAGDADKKLELFVLMGDILQSQGKPAEAQQHLALSYKLRQEQGWRVPPALQQRITTAGVQVDQCPSSQDLLRTLRTTWQALQRASRPRHTGSITQLSDSYGFITVESGASHYFRISEFHATRNKLREGLRVTFALEPGYDRKKQQDTMNAVDVVPA